MITPRIKTLIGFSYHFASLGYATAVRWSKKHQKLYISGRYSYYLSCFWLCVTSLYAAAEFAILWCKLVSSDDRGDDDGFNVLYRLVDIHDHGLLITSVAFTTPYLKHRDVFVQAFNQLLTLDGYLTS